MKILTKSLCISSCPFKLFQLNEFNRIITLGYRVGNLYKPIIKILLTSKSFCVKSSARVLGLTKLSNYTNQSNLQKKRNVSYQFGHTGNISSLLANWHPMKLISGQFLKNEEWRNMCLLELNDERYVL